MEGSGGQRDGRDDGGRHLGEGEEGEEGDGDREEQEGGDELVSTLTSSPEDAEAMSEDEEEAEEEEEEERSDTDTQDGDERDADGQDPNAQDSDGQDDNGASESDSEDEDTNDDTSEDTNEDVLRGPIIHNHENPRPHHIPQHPQQQQQHLRLKRNLLSLAALVIAIYSLFLRQTLLSDLIRGSPSSRCDQFQQEHSDGNSNTQGMIPTFLILIGIPTPRFKISLAC